MNKLKEELKYEYDNLSDDELIDMLEESALKYATITKSTKIAKELMEEYKVEFIPLYNSFISDFCLLIAYCKKRGISFSKKLLNYEIDNEDIVERLMEQETLKVKLLDEHIASHQKGKIGLLPVVEEDYRHYISDAFDYMVSKAEQMDLNKRQKRKKQREKIKRIFMVTRY